MARLARSTGTRQSCGLGQTPQTTLWVAAERLAQFRALWPTALLSPDIVPPTDEAPRAWSPDEALTEILRGRLEGMGPATPGALATPLGLEPDEINAALIALEVEGFVLRGRFTPGGNAEGSGATVVCSHASITTRFDGCAPRSSRSQRVTSCASCSTGSV